MTVGKTTNKIPSDHDFLTPYKYRRLIGSAADEDRNVELFAFSEYLCGLFRNYPAVDDCVKADLRILAPRVQNLISGNAAEISQLAWIIRNSQIIRQAFPHAFTAADDRVVRKRRADVLVESALAISALHDRPLKQTRRHWGRHE